MKYLEPKSSALKKAVKWISEEKKIKPDDSVKKLAETAIFRFDLSPSEAEFLYRFLEDDSNNADFFNEIP
jgi:hypothetical protein